MSKLLWYAVPPRTISPFALQRKSGKGLVYRNQHYWLSVNNNWSMKTSKFKTLQDNKTIYFSLKTQDEHLPFSKSEIETLVRPCLNVRQKQNSDCIEDIKSSVL